MGSHTIFIGDVVDILVGDDADPLIYFDGDFRNLNLVADRQERNMRPGQVS
jgi:flavin reductase (DIM6/NTAB) family NADH-FMN oxidoreductase RutF